MKIASKSFGSVTVLAFEGEFDAIDLPAVHEAMKGLLEEGRDRLVFNFRNLTFINSTWIGYVIETAKVLRARGGELVLSEPSQFFGRVGKVLGVDRILKVFPDDGTAVEHFGTDGATA